MEQDAAYSIPPAGDRNGNALCGACGLCCRGVCFSHVELDESEIEPARRIRMPVEMVDVHAQFQQPCVLHDGKGCTAYQTRRPRRCVAYRCSLLNRFDAGEVTFDEALRHVITARTMADRVQNEAGLMAGGLIGNAFLNRLEASPGGDINGVPPLSPMTKLNAVALRIYFDKHFRKGKGGRVSLPADARVDLRVLLATILAGGRPSWPVASGDVTHELVKHADREGVSALVDKRLRELPTGDLAAPPEVREAFSAAARSEALPSMLFQAEALRALSLMAEAGIPGLLLKGSALAHWAYAQPHLRACGDVDLLLPTREAAEQLSARLTANGYERAETSGELVAYELLCRRTVAGGWQLEVDIHWRLANSPLFADVFTFDELMAESIALPRLAPNARGLGPVHALLHACVHRALNLSIGTDDKLKWLYDLEILTALFTPADWQRLTSLSIRKGLAGVVFDALKAAAETFGHDLSDELTAPLLHAAAAEPLDARRLSDWRYMQLKTYESLPTTRLRLRWLWQRLFPSRDYLRYLYGSEHKSYLKLMLLRSRRAVELLWR